jgi:methionine-rich copper-binding protein CopC
MVALLWLAVAGLLWLAPMPLEAHGTLVRSAPAAETQVSERPSEIRLWFNESIEHRFSRITVHRAKRDETTGKLQPQQRVDEGLVDGPRVTRELAVKLPATLAPGLYLVQWQVLSIDSHRTTGKFTLTYEPQADKANPSR